MTQAYEITVSDNAIRQGRACGLFNDTEARVRGLARVAMPTKHPAGNRAYGPFVLHMRGGQVVSITMVGPRPTDARPVTECRVCAGLMIRRFTTTIDGKEGTASRPCPRAFDPSQPLCDTILRRQP